MRRLLKLLSVRQWPVAQSHPIKCVYILIVSLTYEQYEQYEYALVSHIGTVACQNHIDVLETFWLFVLTLSNIRYYEFYSSHKKSQKHSTEQCNPSQAEPNTNIILFVCKHIFSQVCHNNGIRKDASSTSSRYTETTVNSCSMSLGY